MKKQGHSTAQGRGNIGLRQLAGNKYNYHVQQLRMALEKMDQPPEQTTCYAMMCSPARAGHAGHVLFKLS